MLVNFDPNNLCLESPELGSVPLVLHSSRHLLLSLGESVEHSGSVHYNYRLSQFFLKSCESVQKRDEQTVDSLQPRDQVVDKRAEPDEERAAESSMVRSRRDHPYEFTVPLDDPNEEIPEQWPPRWVHVETISVQLSPTEFPVVSPRGDAATTSVRVSKRRFVSFRTNSEISTPRECDSDSASRGPCCGASTEAINCCLVPTLFPCTSPVWSASTNQTHFQGISRAPTNGTSVVGKIAKTGKMMCLQVLMVGATPCFDRMVHEFPVVDALPTTSPCVDIFHVDPSHSRDSVVWNGVFEENV